MPIKIFMGVPPVKWNGNMHCWWPGNGRDNQSGQCASRYGTGTNDYVQTSFPKVGRLDETKWFHPNRTPSRSSHHRYSSCSRC